jgi:hypothetical protein
VNDEPSDLVDRLFEKYQIPAPPEKTPGLVEQYFGKDEVPPLPDEFSVQLDKVQRRLDFLQQAVKDIDASIQDLQLNLECLWSELAKPDEVNKAPSPFRDSDPELSPSELAQALRRPPVNPPQYDPDKVFYKDRGPIAPAEVPEPTAKVSLTLSQLFDVLSKLAPPPEKMRKAGK